MKGGVERISTCISGLDAIIGGGMPKGSAVLVTGPAGCGKTLIAMQFITEGAKKGEKGLYISFEENRNDLVSQAAQFGWDVETLEREGKMKVMNFNMSNMHVLQVITEIEKAIQNDGYKRLSLDSITVLGMYASIVAGAEMLQAVGMKRDSGGLPSGETVWRGAIMGIIGKIKHMNITSLIVSELPESTHYLSRDTISEFACDGIIRLAHSVINKRRKKFIEVIKMRQTAHDNGVHEVIIGKTGVSVKEGIA